MPHLPTIHLGSILGFVLGVLLLARELGRRHAPSVTLAWFLIIVMVPYVGVPLYLVFGGRKRARRAAKKKALYPALRAPPSSETPIERLLDGMGVPSATYGNTLKILPTGEEAFASVLDLIDGAERRIHIATFILGGDEAGNTIVRHLTARAKKNVEVRLLIDGVFAFRPNRRLLGELRQAGGRVAVFMPLIHIPFRGRSNLRDHRKIAVADGTRAIFGGMNLAEEYMGPRPSASRWRDIALCVRGGAAADLDAIFREDWAFAAREELAADDAAATSAISADSTKADETGGPVRIVASGPDVETDTLYDAILFALFSAEERIWIATPYFVPDEALVRALVLACRRGIDVRLVVPVPSNHFTADLAGASYMRDVEEAGGSIRPYTSGMLHAKVFVIDEALAMVGSANLDMRSLFLNYEVMAILYGREDVRAMAAWYEGVLARCEPRMKKAGRVRIAAEDVGRLFGPLV